MKNKLLILYRTIMTTNPAQRDKQKRVWSHDVYFIPSTKRSTNISCSRKTTKKIFLWMSSLHTHRDHRALTIESLKPLRIRTMGQLRL